MRSPLPLLERDVPTREVHPLDVSINGELAARALLYFASGFCAQASAIMDDPKTRERTKSIKNRQLQQLYMAGQATKLYFGNEAIEELPRFEVSAHEREASVSRGMTDIVALNTPRMAQALNGGVDYSKRPDFWVCELDARRLLHTCRTFLGKAALNNIPGIHLPLPGSATDYIDCLFHESARLQWQVDGEGSVAENVQRLQINKSPQSVTMVDAA